MDSKKRSRSVTQKGVSSKSKTKDVALKDDTVKELPLKDEFSWKIGRGDKSKGGEKSAAKKKRSRGGDESTKRKTNFEKSGAKERGNEKFQTPLKRKTGADGEIVQAFLLSTEKGSSRLRPRKEVPTFSMVELAEEDGERLIGKRVKIYWSGSRKWFGGCIKAFDNKKMLHTIYYDDGDREVLNLSEERFQLEVMPGETFTLKVEAKSERKGKGLDDGMVIADFLKKKSGVGGNADLKKASESLKKEEPQKSLERGSSMPKRKDAEDNKAEDLVTEMEVDLVPKDVIEGGDANEESQAQASRMESTSEIMDMSSNSSEERGNTVKGKENAAQPGKKHVKLNKKAGWRAAKSKRSKTQITEVSKEEEKLSASIEFDGHHAEGQPDTMCLETNLEGSSNLSSRKAGSPTKESKPGNGGISQEAEASQLNLDSDKNEPRLNDDKFSRVLTYQKRIKFRGVASDGRCITPRGVEDNKEGLAADVEVSVLPLQVEEKVVGGDINVERPMVISSVKKSDEAESLSQAVTEGICKESLNLQPIESESLEEDHEKGKLKIENKESSRVIPKETLEANVSEGMTQTTIQGAKQPANNRSKDHTILTGLDFPKSFVRRARTKVERQYVVRLKAEHDIHQA